VIVASLQLIASEQATSNLIQMHEAILHIGTEKTGSTAIQNYLLHNAAEHIEHYGILFPYKTCGLISNFRLVLFTKSELDESLARLDKTMDIFSSSDAQAYEHWKSQFSTNHTKAIKAFQANRESSKVIYSSEHFHSRVQNEDDIRFLKSHLDTLYQRVTIMFYVRRQDQCALSAYNTAVQGGRSTDLSFAAFKQAVPYFDYLSLAQRWSNVFGKENVKPIIFDSRKLKDGDVTKDFEFQIGLDDTKHDLSTMKYQTSNERLSYSALQVLIEFNLIEETDPRLNGVNKNAIRQQLINEVHSIKDDFGTIRPARSEVDAIACLGSIPSV